jgi:hypothetical protein
MKSSLNENELDNNKEIVTEKLSRQQRCRFVKMRGLYPKGGPKIVREEFERLGFTYLPGNAPNGFKTDFLFISSFEGCSLG